MAHHHQLNKGDLELWRRRAPRSGFWFNVHPNHPEINPYPVPDNQIHAPVMPYQHMPAIQAA
jgi:hypothetical protein